jgi:subtilisin family serine protease
VRRRPRSGLLALVVSVCVLAVLALAPSASPRTATQSSYIVVLNPGVDPSAFVRKLGVTAEQTYTAALDGFAAELSPGQLKKVQGDPAVQTVVADDASFSFASQTVGNAVKRVDGLSSPTANIDGSDERVDADIAIIDSGIDSGHPDLNVVGGHDCGGSGTLEDFVDHGTLVAGIAAALDNGIGIVGLAPGARLWSVPIENGKGKVRESAVICALDWVEANAGTIEVANISVGRNGQDTPNCGFNPQGKIRDPLHAAVCAVVAAGVTITVSAGNAAEDAAKNVPAAYDEAITVSAIADFDGQPGGAAASDCFGSTSTEVDDTFASFSNFGPDVDIAAPGVCIESTANDGGYDVVDGTSFSAPLVAGAAALWKAAHPTATPAQVKAAILANRETGHIAGDPDGIDEGVLNVAGF